LGQSKGSLTCPFAGVVTAGVHNEDVRICSSPVEKMTQHYLPRKSLFK